MDPIVVSVGTALNKILGAFQFDEEGIFEAFYETPDRHLVFSIRIF
jgi:hypothetical protein